MDKIALALIAGTLTLTLMGTAQADTQLRVGNSMTVVTIPSSNDRDRSFASSRTVRPAPMANDAAFLRRSSLDISGKIPVVNDVRRFLSDRSQDKRAATIERLLESPGYVNHFTTMYLELLVPEGKADFQKRYLTMGMHSWLRKQFAANTRWL